MIGNKPIQRITVGMANEAGIRFMGCGLHLQVITDNYIQELKIRS